MSQLLLISTLAALAIISPGPDFALVTSNAMMGSKRAGYLTALGVSSSILLHTTYCVLGIALVIARTKVVFDAVKYVGAIYLCYIGIKGLLSKRSTEISGTKGLMSAQSGWRLFMQGFLCNALNPKTTFFFLSLFTMVIEPTTPAYVQALYGLEIAGMHMIWFSIITAIITHERLKERVVAIQYYIVKLMGVALVYFSFRIFTYAVDV